MLRRGGRGRGGEGRRGGEEERGPIRVLYSRCFARARIERRNGGGILLRGRGKKREVC